MSNKASLIRISKNFATKLDLTKFMLKMICMAREINLSDSQLTVLSYFIIYGINTKTKDLILNAKVCKNLNVIKGIMTKLKKNNFIYKDDLNGKTYIAEDLRIPLNDTIGLYFKLSVDEHRHG